MFFFNASESYLYCFYFMNFKSYVGTLGKIDNETSISVLEFKNRE